MTEFITREVAIMSTLKNRMKVEVSMNRFYGSDVDGLVLCAKEAGSRRKIFEVRIVGDTNIAKLLTMRECDGSLGLAKAMPTSDDKHDCEARTLLSSLLVSLGEWKRLRNISIPSDENDVLGNLLLESYNKAVDYFHSEGNGLNRQASGHD